MDVGAAEPDTAGPGRRADIAAAMAAIDRARFLPRGQVKHAGEDRALSLFHGQTCSQPSTVAAMLELLQVPVGADVLDVGSGSGWTTALLARLVGPTGSVLGLEIDEGLCVFGAANLAAWQMPWARIERADPQVLGRPREGGWPRILVSATARRLPPELVGQMADDSRMVLPVGRQMTLVVREGGGRPSLSVHGEYLFVPLLTP